MSPSRGPIMPGRVRNIRDQSFCFIPHRFLQDGFFSTLSCEELALYVFLILAADRNGMSYYSFERICSVLELCLEDFLEARNGLIEKDLIAFDGRRFQVLSLPAKPVFRPCKPMQVSQDLEVEDRATVRSLVLDSLRSDPAK
jgi:hypothetical protein